MDDNQPDYIKELEAEYDKLANHSRMTDQQIRSKFYRWLFRLVVSIILAVLFWEHRWVRILTIIWIPISIVTLLMIFGYNHLINRKLHKVEDALEKLKKVGHDAGD